MEKIPPQITYIEKNDPINERNVDIIMDSVKTDLSVILEKMRTSIDNHSYGCIFGIDGGGRIPALTLRKTLNHIYLHNHQDKIETFFVSGSRASLPENTPGEKEFELKNLLKKEIFQKIKSRNEKILLVEDVVVSGESLKLIIKIMKELDISYEIATLSFGDSEIINPTYKEETDIKQLEDKLGSKILCGEYGSISKLYGSKQMSGVHKKQNILFSKPIGKSFYNNQSDKEIPQDNKNLEDNMQNREILKHTRDLISKISKELSDEYIKGY